MLSRLLLLILLVELRTAASLSLGGCTAHRRVVVVTWPAVVMSSSVDEDSSLADLRAYVKEQGLDVKTAGPGRNKASILEDINKALFDFGTAPAAATAPVAEAKAAPAELEDEPPAEAPPADEARTAAAPDEEFSAAAPDGFTWGGTF